MPVRTGQIIYRTDRGDVLQVLVRLGRRVEGEHALDGERSGGEAEGFCCGLCFRCAPTTGRHLRPAPWRACRGFRCGGSSWASFPSASKSAGFTGCGKTLVYPVDFAFGEVFGTC